MQKSIYIMKCFVNCVHMYCMCVCLCTHTSETWSVHTMPGKKESNWREEDERTGRVEEKRY